MKPVVIGFKDSLNILAFKWRGIKPTSQRAWLIAILVVTAMFVLGTAFSGTALKTFITIPATGNTNEIKDTVLVWINIFLANNASIAAGGVLWALLASMITVPLVGYSFTAIIPEEDISAMRVSQNHKITDSLFLQFVSTISFVQILTLTAITSVLSLGSESPGLSIVMAWMLWVLFVIFTTITAWSFEWLNRKYGLKSKIIFVAAVASLIGGLWFFNKESFLGMFGLGEYLTHALQNSSINNLMPFLLVLLGFVIIVLVALFLLGFVGSHALQHPERIKKKNMNRVFLARIGFMKKNKIGSTAEFLGNMVLRQPNIWKPIMLALVFTIGMSVAFYNFYDILFTVAVVIPVMVSLTWGINVFGIIGSGVTWLVTLPWGKQKLLNAVTVIQYVLSIAIGICVMGAVVLVHDVSIQKLGIFFAMLIINTAIVTQFSIKKAVLVPFRYRVSVKGESALPPNKAFVYMVQLFALGFITSGVFFATSQLLMIGVALLGWNVAVASTIGGLLLITVVLWLVRVRYNALSQRWVADTTIIQNIIKTVGV